MIDDTTPQSPHRVFYGWLALAGVMLVIFIVGGAFVNSFGVLLPVITEEFGWERAVVSLALSLGIMAFGIPSPLYGIIVNRLGPRLTIIVGNGLTGLALCGVYFVQEVWHIYLLYILMGLGGGFGGYIACTTVVNNWFVKRRSLALGIFTACAGLGGFVFPPLSTVLISSLGWRVSWLVLGGIVLFIPVLIGGLLIRNRPEDMGLLPDGAPPSQVTEPEPEVPVEDGLADTGRNIRQVMKTPTAWFIGLLAGTNAFTTGTMITHQIAYLRDIGFEAITAATTLSFMSVFSIIGSITFGTLALRLPVRCLAVTACIIQVTGLVILLTTHDLGFIYLYAAFQGFSSGSLITALPTFVGAYYPRRQYSQVIGVLFPFQVISNAISATVAGAIYDAAGTYTPAFITLTLTSSLGIAMAFLSRPPKKA